METSSNNTNPLNMTTKSSELNCSTFFHPLSISSRSETHQYFRPSANEKSFPIQNNINFCNFDSQELQTSSEIIYSTNKEKGFEEYYKKQKNIVRTLNQTANLSWLLTSEIFGVEKQSVIIHTALDKQRGSFFENAVELYSKEEFSLICCSSNILDISNDYSIHGKVFFENDVTTVETNNALNSFQDILQSENIKQYCQEGHKNLFDELKYLITKIKNYEESKNTKLDYSIKIKKESIVNELLDLIEVYRNIDKLGSIVDLILNGSINKCDIKSLLLMCDSFIKDELINYLNLRPFARVKSLLQYSKRFKELQSLKQQYLFKKVFQFSIEKKEYFDWLPVFIKLPSDLIKNLNYTINCYPRNQDESYDQSLLSSIGNTYEKMDYSILMTNCFYFKLLEIFSMISHIYEKVFKDNYQKQDVNLFLHTYIIIIFKFLNISEILRSNELLIRIYSLFDELIITSCELNSLELFINFTKEKCKAYKQKLKNISMSCRSLSPLDKLNKNYWGKYSVTHKCIQEFEIKCNEAILNKNKKNFKAQPTNNFWSSVSDISLILSSSFGLFEEMEEQSNSNLKYMEKLVIDSYTNKRGDSRYINKNSLNKNLSVQSMKKMRLNTCFPQNTNSTLEQGHSFSTSNNSHTEKEKISGDPTKKYSLFEIFNINPKICKSKIKQVVFHKSNSDCLVTYRSLVIMTGNIQKKTKIVDLNNND